MKKTFFISHFATPTSLKLETICGGLGGAGSKYNGVPHWGKKNWASREDLLPFYGQAAFDAFEALRAPLDPTGIFLNDYLRDRGVGVGV